MSLIKSNILEVLNQFKEEVIPEVDRKMRHMVYKFVYSVAVDAQALTPLGDSEKYYKLYMQRYNNTGLKAVEGHAQSSWQITYWGKGVKGGYVPETALADIGTKLETYKVGQTVNLKNNAMYIGALENGHSEQAQYGIMYPVEKLIMSVYQNNLAKYYKEG